MKALTLDMTHGVERWKKQLNTASREEYPSRIQKKGPERPTHVHRPVQYGNVIQCADCLDTHDAREWPAGAR